MGSGEQGGTRVAQAVGAEASPLARQVGCSHAKDAGRGLEERVTCAWSHSCGVTSWGSCVRLPGGPHWESDPHGRSLGSAGRSVGQGLSWCRLGHDGSAGREAEGRQAERLCQAWGSCLMPVCSSAGKGEECTWQLRDTLGLSQRRALADCMPAAGR